MSQNSAKRVRFEQYLFPDTLEDCVKMLSEQNGKARVMAGGTDLVLWARSGQIEQNIMIDISRIEGIDTINTSRQDMIVIGAGATHADVAANVVVKERFSALANGCRSVGSPQIRHIATLGGNIVSAQPAADSVIPMVVLDAKCEIFSSEGSRVESIDNLHVGVGKSRVNPTCEVIARIFLPIPEGRYGTAFTRIAAREAMALPIVNCAVRVLLEGNIITSARIALAPVAVTPFRATRTEEYLVGKDITDDSVAIEAGRVSSEEANPRDSLQRGSGIYRKVLAGDLVTSALQRVDIREGV